MNDESSGSRPSGSSQYDDMTPEELEEMHRAEDAAENAWLRHAEREDPEAQADLAYHDFLFPDGYGA